VGSNSLCSLPRYVPHVAGFRRGPAQSKKLKKAIWSCSGGRRVCAAAPLDHARKDFHMETDSSTGMLRIRANCYTKASMMHMKIILCSKLHPVYYM
jgi:hypothetical protein